MNTSRPVVLVTEPIHPVGPQILAREVEVINLPERPGDSIDEHLPDVHAILVRTARLGAERIRAASRLRVIGKHGVGVDNVDVAAAQAHDIAIVSTPGANAQAVAEHALTMMLMLARRMPTTTRMLREGQFDAARAMQLPVDLHGQTLGLVGLGNVGTRLAAMCRSALAMRIIAYDPYVTADRAAALGVELTAELAPLLRASDVISIHAPLTPTTRGIVGRDALAQLKPTVILINCARGGLVDEVALLEALRAGRLAGAGLDAFVEEPFPPNHPLLALENVVATPHIAGGSQKALEIMARTVAEDILRVLRGELPMYPYHG
jgi:D-3-phosphoglycerate dehydrogenase